MFCTFDALTLRDDFVEKLECKGYERIANANGAEIEREHVRLFEFVWIHTC